jgi:hypothetical protein
MGRDVGENQIETKKAGVAAWNRRASLYENCHYRAFAAYLMFRASARE